MTHIHITLTQEDEKVLAKDVRTLLELGVPVEVAKDVMSRQFHMGVAYGLKEKGERTVVVHDGGVQTQAVRDD